MEYFMENFLSSFFNMYGRLQNRYAHKKFQTYTYKILNKNQN